MAITRLTIRHITSVLHTNADENKRTPPVRRRCKVMFQVEISRGEYIILQETTENVQCLRNQFIYN